MNMEGALPAPALATYAAAAQPNSTWADIILAAGQDYHEHGFCILPPGSVPDAVCGNELKLSAIHQARWRLTHTDQDRTSINSRQLLTLPPWQSLLRYVTSADSIVGQVMDHLFGDAWWFDRCGGEAVAPHAQCSS